MTEKLREYNVKEIRKGKHKNKMYHVSIDYKSKNYMNASFNDEGKAKMSADITIIKNNLPYKTKRIKPLNR